ncbi:Ribonuclease 3 [Mycobacterium innocens]|uniref:Ribonuclease 3 n=1 Tax=Mycobacterium innocens TaxID=2341083 RepID=A0A498PUE1_9MYCO|nr:ribonuclease III [Mycobacterium innocens]KZS73304.1 ribonuclease III [Mycobacterium kansasii]VBA37358.1 Ribonuclease 3 [Mycobacterium innocens]
MTASSRQSLLDALGVDLSDELLSLALTHRSYAYENGGLPTNERLEFLGDAVLGLTITDELYHRHPDRSEGDLAKLRASVVNTQALADVARNLSDNGLGVHMLLGRGEANTGGADKSSILADGMESLLGAIYLQHGIEVSRKVILKLFGPLLDAAATLGAGLDWKTSLQELTAARGLGTPSYQVTSTGPDHDKEFTAAVVVMDAEYGSGMGRSKKEAEQKAASAAYKALEALDVLDTAGKPSP